MNKTTLFTVLFAALAFSSTALFAAGGMGMGKGNKDRGDRQAIMKAAVDACAGIAEGDSCTFIGRNDQEVAGACAVTRKADVNICRRDGEREGRRGGRRGDRDGAVKPAKEVETL